MIKVVVCGASGRMGQIIGRMVSEAPDLELVGGINLIPGSFFGADIVETRNAEALLQKVKPDVLIDFTIAAAAVGNVKMAARNNVALIVGTTGISPEQQKEMEAAIHGHVPAVISSNFSVGVSIFLLCNTVSPDKNLDPKFKRDQYAKHLRFLTLLRDFNDMKFEERKAPY